MFVSGRRRGNPAPVLRTAPRAPVYYNDGMSLAELQQEVGRLTADERLQLIAYLRQLEQANDSDWLQELDRRDERMSRGEKHGVADLDRTDATRG